MYTHTHTHTHTHTNTHMYQALTLSSYIEAVWTMGGYSKQQDLLFWMVNFVITMMAYLRQTCFSMFFWSSSEPSVQNLSTILHIVLAACWFGILCLKILQISLAEVQTKWVFCFVLYCKVLKDCSSVMQKTNFKSLYSLIVCPLKKRYLQGW